jgi:hypothetical protein
MPFPFSIIMLAVLYIHYIFGCFFWVSEFIWATTRGAPTVVNYKQPIAVVFFCVSLAVVAGGDWCTVWGGR